MFVNERGAPVGIDGFRKMFHWVSDKPALFIENHSQKIKDYKINFLCCCDGQLLLKPTYELEGWWTSLEEPPEAVIQRYKAHATHEQFHSEIKTDLDLERLPSGKLATNDLILHLAQLA